MARETWQEPEKSLYEYLEDREWLTWWWIYESDWIANRRNPSADQSDRCDETESSRSLAYLSILVVAYVAIVGATLLWPRSPRNYPTLPDNLSLSSEEPMVWRLY